MDLFDILILSNVRPGRAWKIASRVTREVPGTRICGIVQQNPGQLPPVQRLIAGGKTQKAFSPYTQSSLKSWFHCTFEHLVDWTLWLAHGCPSNSFLRKEFTVERLAEECGRAGWPILLSESIRPVGISNFIRQNSPHLILALGEVPVEPQLTCLASGGLIRICQIVAGTDTTGNSEKGFSIEIQYFSRDAQSAFILASFNVAGQPYDGLLGLTLKSDLIANDLLVRGVASLQKADIERTSKEIAEWAEKIFLPSLGQLEKPKSKALNSVPEHRRYHPLWKMCVGTLLLCSPVFAFRNLYRRLRRQYPLRILTHHLVSDRPHKLGVSTQDFWRHICFLQRHYRIVSLSEGIEMLRSGRIEVPTLALTFDDGYADNFVSLRAVAEETETPLTLFVATQPVETQTEFQHDSADGVRGFLPLAWDQLRYWGDRGTEFGSHTRTHLDCGSHDTTILREEMIGSKNDLEGHLGKLVQFFAFPFGQARNMSAEAMRLAASVYKYFLSSLGGINLPASSGCHQHLLRKSHCADLWELELELQSVFEFGKSFRRDTETKKGRSIRRPFALPTWLFALSRRHRSTDIQADR